MDHRHVAVTDHHLEADHPLAGTDHLYPCLGQVTDPLENCLWNMIEAGWDMGEVMTMALEGQEDLCMRISGNASENTKSSCARE